MMLASPLEKLRGTRMAGHTASAGRITNTHTHFYSLSLCLSLSHSDQDMLDCQATQFAMQPKARAKSRCACSF